MNNDEGVGAMLGLTMASVEDVGDEVVFKSECGRQFRLLHNQSCCETVELDDVCGDLSDLVGYPLLISEEVSNIEPPNIEREWEPESETWTFYKFSTVKGDVTLRWHGESNGYYSESVDFEEFGKYDSNIWV
jgi:hypothetical protein